MAFLHDDILDNGLSSISGANLELHICSAEPATYANVATYTLGNKLDPTVGAVADGVTNGRRRTVAAITDGTVTATGTATHWALVDTTVTARLLAAKSLSASQAVTSGNTFTLTAFDLAIPDAAA